MSDKKINHLGIIMDGNRRWAKEQGLPPMNGHQIGYEKLKEVGDWCLEEGIKVLTVFAFSTENWKRPKIEVDFLMALLEKGLRDEINEFLEKGIQLRVSGRLSELPESLQKAIAGAVEKTKENTKGILNILINYGGRAEIIDAVKKIVNSGVSEEEISEDLISANMYQNDLGDPEFIIRTSGEQRMSGFLTWQNVYSEYYFCNNHWPAFSREDLSKALDVFYKRERRFGGSAQ